MKSSSPGIREVEGVVVAQLPSALYRVDVSGREVTAHLSGDPRRNFIRVLVGDRVRVLLAPGDLRSDRANQLDFRVGKILRFGRSRANVALDLFNALNFDTILVPNQAFIPGGGWLTPTGTQTPVMTARTAKITVQYDF